MLLGALLLAFAAAAGFYASDIVSGSQVEERLADYDRRLDDIERTIERNQAELLAQLKKSRTEPPKSRVTYEQRVAGMRKAQAEKYRQDYRQLMEEIRKVTAAGGEQWKAAETALQRYFGPMEKALAHFVSSPGWRRPRIREVVAPHTAGTFEELRAALGEEAWKKFDAWRRPGTKQSSSAIWRRPRYSYFLLPEEYQAANTAAAAGLRWNMAKSNIKVLLGRLRLPRHEEDELRAVLRDHYNRYSAAVGGLGARRPAGSETKVRAALKLTEEKLQRLLGEKFKQYLEWKAALRGPARRHFTAPAAAEPKKDAPEGMTPPAGRPE